MHVGVLPTCMCVTTWVWCPQRQEQGVGPLGLELQRLLLARTWVLGLKERPLKKQSMLLTAVPSPSLQMFTFVRGALGVWLCDWEWSGKESLESFLRMWEKRKTGNCSMGPKVAYLFLSILLFSLLLISAQSASIHYPISILCALCWDKLLKDTCSSLSGTLSSELGSFLVEQPYSMNNGSGNGQSQWKNLGISSWLAYHCYAVRDPIGLLAGWATIRERWRMKLQAVPSLQALGQKPSESDLVVYSSHTFKHSKTLGRGFHGTIITTKL